MSETTEVRVELTVGEEARRLLEARPDAVVLAFKAALAHELFGGETGEPVTEAPEINGFRKILVSKAEEERYVLGIVMEPDSVDTEGDTQTPETCRKACFGWMEAYRGGGKTGHQGLMHKSIIDGKVVIVENYIQKGDAEIDDEPIKDGTWLQGWHVLDDQIWEDTKAGKYTGFSIGGTAVRDKP